MQGGAALRIDPYQLLDDSTYGQQLSAQAAEQIRRGAPCLLFSSGEPEEVRAVQQWGAQRGWSVPELGTRLATAMADLARVIMLSLALGDLPGGLIVAGGETAGAVCRALNLGALHIGRNITPGVPLCFALGEFRLPVVLKSGNFGAVDFLPRHMLQSSKPLLILTKY